MQYEVPPQQLGASVLPSLIIFSSVSAGGFSRFKGMTVDLSPLVSGNGCKVKQKPAILVAADLLVHGYSFAPADWFPTPQQTNANKYPRLLRSWLVCAGVFSSSGKPRAKVCSVGGGNQRGFVWWIMEMEEGGESRRRSSSRRGNEGTGWEPAKDRDQRAEK